MEILGLCDVEGVLILQAVVPIKNNVLDGVTLEGALQVH